MTCYRTDHEYLMSLATKRIINTIHTNIFPTRLYAKYLQQHPYIRKLIPAKHYYYIRLSFFSVMKHLLIKPDTARRRKYLRQTDRQPEPQTEKPSLLLKYLIYLKIAKTTHD